MQGKTVLITGSSSGIGKATALALAEKGATVVLHARNQQKADTTQAAIQTQIPGARLESLVADFESLEEVNKAMVKFKAAHSSLDVLINNAAVMLPKRRLTSDGFEAHLAVNHLAHFLLTHLLLEILKAPGSSRIINLTSGLQQAIDFDDLQGENRYKGFRNYGMSKSMNILFTYELARRLKGTGVTVNCVHPGVVRTGLGRYFPGWFKSLYRLAELFILSPEKGAETSVYLASSPKVEGISGKYFKKKKAITSAAHTYETEDARRLWSISKQLTGLK